MTFRTGATFSDDMVYRYRLWRRWDETAMPLMFLLLNPSTANEFEDDPTVARCIKRARRMGFGGVEVCNLYARRSTDPDLLYNLDPRLSIGPDNESEIFAASQICSSIICGWGTHGKKVNKSWPDQVREIIKSNRAVSALGFNEDGSPKHPLYLGYNIEPVPFVLDDD